MRTMDIDNDGSWHTLVLGVTLGFVSAMPDFIPALEQYTNFLTKVFQMLLAMASLTLVVFKLIDVVAARKLRKLADKQKTENEII